MGNFRFPGPLNNVVHELEEGLGTLQRSMASLRDLVLHRFSGAGTKPSHEQSQKKHRISKRQAKAKAQGQAKATAKPAAGRKALSEADYEAAARALGKGISAKLVRAFAMVESGGRSGFGASGLPIIAYEGHVFRRFTHGRFDKKHPMLSYVYKKKAGPQWQHNNHDQATAWKTLRAALALDHDAALMACSWGMFQILGMNYQMCGYKTVDSFVAAMKTSAYTQLQAFVGFCKHRKGCVAAMQALNYAGMASAYNGPDYGNYDKQIETAYKKLGGT